MSIDWDNLADEMGDTPRSRLLQVLDDADDMSAVLIVYEKKGESHLESTYYYTTGLRAGAANASLLGLAEWARASILRGMTEDE